MTNKIGFAAEFFEGKQEPDAFVGGGECLSPRKSVVQVYFANDNRTLAYYNDRFDLREGDMVYVEGSKAGIRGRVTGINYNFKIKVSDYKRVIFLVDTHVSGQFFMGGSHFVTFDRETLPRSQVITWYKAPTTGEEEVVTGSDDSSIFLEDLSGMNVTPAIAQRGREYYLENRVRYLCIDGTKGYAIVEGSEAYEVEFEYLDGEIWGLVCDCYCSYNCKHEFAAMLQLRETLGLICRQYAELYEASGYFAAIHKAALFAFAIDQKEAGSFTL